MDRRRFLRGSGLTAAIPAVAAAKLLGAAPVKSELPPIRNGDLMTAEGMNARFAEVFRMIKENR